MEGPTEGRADQAWLLPGHSAESFSCKHMLVKWMIWHHQSLSCSSQDLHICSRRCCLFCRSQKHPLIIPGARLGVLPPCGVLHKPGAEYDGPGNDDCLYWSCLFSSWYQESQRPWSKGYCYRWSPDGKWSR